MAIETRIENIAHLTALELELVRLIATDPGWSSLDGAARILTAAFPSWFVYRGGSHIALHRSAAIEASPRVLIVREVA